jgi:hypothetical protein
MKRRLDRKHLWGDAIPPEDGDQELRCNRLGSLSLCCLCRLDLAVRSTSSQASDLTSVIEFVFEYMKPLEVIVSATMLPERCLFIESSVVSFGELFSAFPMAPILVFQIMVDAVSLELVLSVRLDRPLFSIPLNHDL